MLSEHTQKVRQQRWEAKNRKLEKARLERQRRKDALEQASPQPKRQRARTGNRATTQPVNK